MVRSAPEHNTTDQQTDMIVAITITTMVDMLEDVILLCMYMYPCIFCT